jgi:hypothetical protein
VQLLGKSLLVYHLLVDTCMLLIIFLPTKQYETTTTNTALDCAAMLEFVLLLGKSLVHPLVVHAASVYPHQPNNLKQQQNKNCTMVQQLNGKSVVHPLLALNNIMK